jgi:hypothetical protein
VKRTITGRAEERTMTLRDLRQFVASLEGFPDEAPVKARVTWGKHLRSLTVEDENVGFGDYIRSITPEDDDLAPDDKSAASKSRSTARTAKKA